MTDIPDIQSIDEVDSYDDMLSSDDDDNDNEGMEQEHRQQEVTIITLFGRKNLNFFFNVCLRL